MASTASSFLIELVLKQLTGRLPRQCFLHTLVMISDSYCDRNPAKHMMHVTKKCHGYLTSLDTYPWVSIGF